MPSGCAAPPGRSQLEATDLLPEYGNFHGPRGVLQKTRGRGTAVLNRTDRIREQRAMRRRIRVTVALRRLTTPDAQPKQPTGKAAE